MYNADLLKELDEQINRVIYVKIISLDYNESPRETIEGRATSGSINIDGASAVRRTCQLTLVTDTLNISDYYWTLKTKFKVQVGIERNSTGEIIWFEQGTFVISSFSTAYSSNNYTVNISGKDKMCMLNGELGGVINSSLVLDTYDQILMPGVTKKIKNPIKQIIRDLVHQYGGEPFHNIIINDLDIKGMELQEYKYDIPLYLLREEGSSQYSQGTFDGTLGQPQIGSLSRYDSLSSFNGTWDSESTIINGKNYYVAKIEYGDTAGYKEIDLVYPSELTANAGENVVGVLDKIKNMLGDYEYFYDIYGRFIFQQKQTYMNTSWNPSQNSEGAIYVDPYLAATPYSYSFSDSKKFTSFNNTPNLANLKNDYTVWGERPNGNPIHMRYAIDHRPTYYKSIAVSEEELQDYNNKYGLSTSGQESTIYWWRDNPNIEGSVECADWREIIFQMQKDYRKYNHLDNFDTKIIAANSLHYPTGVTGYEQYYIDIEGFWRYLYTPEDIYEKTELTEKTYEPGKYYILNNDEYEISTDNFDKNKTYYSLSENYYPQSHENYPGWNKLVYEHPSELLFWFDFLDMPGSDLDKYSVSAVGIRPKVENDKAVKAIYYGDTPSIIFANFSEGIGNNTGYKYFNIGGYVDMFSKSAQGKSAKDSIDNLLYNYTYCTESITVQSVPIYYLQPNTLVYINDNGAGINGDYVINKITIPLAYNGTMSLNGIKVVQRLY